MSYCRPVPLGFRWPGLPRSDRSATQSSVDQSRTSAHIATPTVGTSRAAEMPTKTGEYSFYIADDGPGTVSFAWPGRSYETAVSKVTTSQVPGKDELQVNLFGVRICQAVRVIGSEPIGRGRTGSGRTSGSTSGA